MRVKLTVTYDGTFFNGWQRQKDKLSGQQILEDAIFSLTGERVKVIGSGRTDAGVHAIGQVCHFDTKTSIPVEKIFLALNTILPPFIKVTKSELAKDNFNARSSAKLKTYRYSVYNSNVEKPLKERFSSRVYGKLDIDLIKKGALLLTGEHDFKAFSSSGGNTKTTVRTITELRVEQDGEDINFFVTGTGFLYNMVRIIVGTLIKVGRGDIPLENISKMLDTLDRSLGGDTMPAKGLCLMQVIYK